MLKKICLFLLAVLIQVLIVAAVPYKQIYTHLTGRLITIKTAPVDPYNFMSGYYVNLRYQISNASLSEDVDGWPIPVYVLLKEDPNKVWIVDSVKMQPPASVPQDKILIRGNANFSWIEYGIETYYIPEDKRQTIESDLQNNRDKTYAQIKVDRLGNAALVRLLIGDTIYEY